MCAVQDKCWPTAIALLVSMAGGHEGQALTSCLGRGLPPSQKSYATACGACDWQATSKPLCFQAF